MNASGVEVEGVGVRPILISAGIVSDLLDGTPVGTLSMNVDKSSGHMQYFMGDDADGPLYLPTKAGSSFLVLLPNAHKPERNVRVLAKPWGDQHGYVPHRYGLGPPRSFSFV